MSPLALIVAARVAIGPTEPPAAEPPAAEPPAAEPPAAEPPAAEPPPPVTTSPFPPPSDADLDRLRSLHVKALQHREAWQTSRDLEQLERAKATLMLWLIEHQRIFGAGDASTEDARATVEAQLRDVDAELKTARPPAPVALDPKIARKAEVMGDRELTAKYRAAERIAIAGYVGLGVGAGTLLFVALPAWRLEELARDRLEDEDRLFTSDEELRERIRRRRTTSLVALGLGTGTLVTGAVLTAVGLRRRSQLLRPRDVAIGPTMGAGEWGLAARGRF